MKALHERESGGVIDGHMEDLVANPALPTPRTLAPDAMASPSGDALQRLRIDVDEVSGSQPHTRPEAEV